MLNGLVSLLKPFYVKWQYGSPQPLGRRIFNVENHDVPWDETLGATSFCCRKLQQAPTTNPHDIPIHLIKKQQANHRLRCFLSQKSGTIRKRSFWNPSWYPCSIPTKYHVKTCSCWRASHGTRCLWYRWTLGFLRLTRGVTTRWAMRPAAGDAILLEMHPEKNLPRGGRNVSLIYG